MARSPRSMQPSSEAWAGKGGHLHEFTIGYEAYGSRRQWTERRNR